MTVREKIGERLAEERAGATICLRDAAAHEVAGKDVAEMSARRVANTYLARAELLQQVLGWMDEETGEGSGPVDGEFPEPDPTEARCCAVLRACIRELLLLVTGRGTYNAPRAYEAVHGARMLVGQADGDWDDKAAEEAMRRWR